MTVEAKTATVRFYLRKKAGYPQRERDKEMQNPESR